MAKEPEIRWEDIRVLHTEEIVVYPEPGKPKSVVAFTYVYQDYPPRTIWIDKDKYTRENILKLVREDLKSILRGPMLPPW